jgi:hypothetical protein
MATRGDIQNGINICAICIMVSLWLPKGIITFIAMCLFIYVSLRYLIKFCKQKRGFLRNRPYEVLQDDDFFE